MRELTDEERREFLLQGGRTGILATVRADGRPHAAPIWFTLDGDDVVFATSRDTVKGRNLLRDRRAVLCVDDEVFPFGFVVLEGSCEISEDLEELQRWTTPIAARYVPEGRAEEFGARNAVPGEMLVRLRPEHVVAQVEIAD